MSGAGVVGLILLIVVGLTAIALMAVVIVACIYVSVNLIQSTIERIRDRR